jgi:CheY-like chemotaxis protein
MRRNPANGIDLAKAEAMSVEAKPSLAGVAVLVVDDDAPSAKMLSLALTAEGCEARVASSAEDAIAMLASFWPRAIVLDLMLPRMNGLLLASKLKQDPATRDTVIIAISAFNGPEVEATATQVGCAAYLSKPLDPIAFPQLLLAHLGAQR